MVNTGEHAAATEPDICLKIQWRPKTELKEREYWIHQMDTNVARNAHASTCLLDLYINEQL